VEGGWEDGGGGEREDGRGWAGRKEIRGEGEKV